MGRHIISLMLWVVCLVGCPAKKAHSSLAEPQKTDRCQITLEKATCSKQRLILSTPAAQREVYFELPSQEPPEGGWPVVLYFQGSFFPGERAFSSNASDSFGQFHLTRTVAALLDAGYAVLAPNTLSDGHTFWQTNLLPWALSWETSADHSLLIEMLEAINKGRFGPLNPARLYAMGISSGGFMTSRMAVSYPGKFRALVVHSASYASCNAACVVPKLPKDHPPTLFLHGKKDKIVPMGTMNKYYGALLQNGTETKSIISQKEAHSWLSEGPQAVVSWFQAHP